MEPTELAEELKNRLEQWSRDFSKIESPNLWYPTKSLTMWNNFLERSLSDCVAQVFKERKEGGWKCFFEVTGPEGHNYDILATRLSSNLWIECKCRKNIRNKQTVRLIKEDLSGLHKIKNDRRYFVLLIQVEDNYEQKVGIITEAMKSIGFSDGGTEVIDYGFTEPKRGGTETARHLLYVQEI